jgi:glycosyltransferase involved in cell wall biosynthesis
MPPSISGFTFVRNALKYDYPVVESLQSMLPLCDEVIVAVGRSEDDTRDLVAGLKDPKLRLVDTIWDDSLRQGGRVLAQQTDIALSHCRSDWCLYLQADEVLHEAEYDNLLAEIRAVHSDSRIEALILKYYHFYGSYDYIGAGRQWYRREIRVIRNTGKVISWRDAQGFRRGTETGEAVKLKARQVNCHVYHYGWVKHPRQQQAKQRGFHQLWHDDAWIAAHIPNQEEFDYNSAQALQRFTEAHPAVMHHRIEKAREWTVNFDPNRLHRRSFGVAILDGFERLTGWRVGEYRNYIEVK